MYDMATKQCGESCPMYSWYDGPLCMVSGGYLEQEPSLECIEIRATFLRKGEKE